MYNTSMIKNATHNIASNNSNEALYGIRDMVLGGTLLGINVCIIILNTLAIMVIVRFRTKNAIDIFVLALAMTDLIKGLIPIPMSVYIYLTDWYLGLGTFACDFFGWIAFSTNSGSMLILTLMSVERFWAVVKPFAYKAWVTPRKVQIIAFTSMIFTGFHSALPVMGVGRILPYYKGAYSHFDYSRYSYGTISYSLFIICYGFGMILVVMIAYSFVFYKIRDLIHRHRRMTTARRYTNRSERELNLKTEKMFSYLTVALMMLFWFSWLPFLMVVIASQIGVAKPHPSLDLFAIRIAVVNSMLNPLACAALCKPYRRGIIYYIKKLFSYVGFQRPESDIWDPWRRGTYRSTRRNGASIVGINEQDRIRSATDFCQSSITDSGIATSEYSRIRLPSVLETYDSFRAKHKTTNTNDNEPNENKRLPTLKETHRSRTDLNDDQPSHSGHEKGNAYEHLITARSNDSGIGGSPETPHGTAGLSRF